MRRTWPKGLAALGLALIASTPALAGDPADCATCGNNPPVPAGATRIKLGHLCAACAAKMKRQGGPAAVMAGNVPTNGLACATCNTGPGYASVGGGAPGTALVGGSIATEEPAPIGVVRTTYGNQGGVVSLKKPMNIRPAAPAPTPISPSRSRRPHIIPHMFFLSGRTLPQDIHEYRMGRRSAQHAAITYGEKENTVNSLPSSMVYKR
jgi:hypothetical protein